MKTTKCTLIETCKNTWVIKEDSEKDLVYSPDDHEKTGKGWYFRTPIEASISYATLYEAVKAFKTNKIKWN